MLRVRVRYGRSADFLKDDRVQLAHRGLFVRVAPPAGLEQFAPARVILEVGGRRAVIEGQVVQVAPGVGVAVSFTESADASLASLRAGAASERTDADVDPVHEVVTDDESTSGGRAGPAEAAEAPPAPSGSAAPAPSGPAAQAPAAAGPLTKKDKIHLALRGSKDQRLKIMRDTDRTLHVYLLKNPRLGLDEVTTLAMTATTSVEVLKAVAERREWYQRPEVAMALVRNPKTPVPIAIRMLDHISKQELRRLAKSDGARMPILQAARRKVIGP